MQPLRTPRLARFVWGVYGVLYAAIFLAVLFHNVIFDYRPLFQLMLMAAWGIVLAGALFLYAKQRDWVLAHRRRILAGVLLTVFFVQLAVGLSTVPNPMYDHGKVFHGAVVFATERNGEAFDVYESYLHHYPNNLGEFLLLQLLFRALTAVGFTDYYFAACLVGHLLFALMIAAGFAYLDELAGGDCALFFLLLTVCFVPVYFQSTVSYTDTYSVWVIPCVLLCALRASRAAALRGRILWGALAGACLGLGWQIKVTVLIAAVALAAQILFSGRLRRAVPALAAAAVMALGINAAFGVWADELVLDPSRVGEAMPVTHWLMMGLQGDGSYSSYDEWFITCSVPYDQRVDNNLRVIRERLEEMGPGGYLRLLYRKTCRTFGSGTADMSYSYQYQDDSPPAGWVYELVLENGRFYALYNNLSHSMYLVLTLLGAAGAFLALRAKSPLLARFAPPLALCGFWLFMMLWESNHRQLVNQWPLYLILAAQGLMFVYSEFCGARKKASCNPDKSMV